MKKVLIAFLATTILAMGQTSNAPSNSTPPTPAADINWRDGRDQAIADIRAKLNSPDTSESDKAHLLNTAVTILDEDSKKFDQLIDAAERLPALQQPSPAPAPAPSAQAGISSNHNALIGSSPIFHVTSKDASEVSFGWKVNVTNNEDQDIGDFTITISYRDANDIEIGHSLRLNNSIRGAATATVTDSDSLAPDIWRQVDHSVVTFEIFHD